MSRNSFPHPMASKDATVGFFSFPRCPAPALQGCELPFSGSWIGSRLEKRTETAPQP